MKPALSLIAASVFVLSACGGSSNESSIPGLKSDTNVALLSRGASASSSHNSNDANNLIDGNSNTSWTSEPDTPIIISLKKEEAIKSIKLTRLAESASTGDNPDILIELSINSVFIPINKNNNTVSCSNTQTLITCNMDPRQTNAIRITSKNGRSYLFFELEAFATK
ncbi:discoidin domain-containing protein [Thalassolituus hydrocarboniclasticus]|uniref:Discoidin domain-containing protein n=1 Tax=Thalassolituus hydrocarboniclasticus TaxID=2742796 RepID=A0ABY6A8I5_9GAMM|nr:discoidin domain-containing protein [Thalassolituus hydrocarboniclasticus]UXD87271.1 discoidin domain-containing protein [Thalassolituus hydrocarboniclasticus]